MTAAKRREIVEAIERRVRPTICETFSFGTGVASIEGRISRDDFETLIILAAGEPAASTSE